MSEFFADVWVFEPAFSSPITVASGVESADLLLLFLTRVVILVWGPGPVVSVALVGIVLLGDVAAGVWCYVLFLLLIVLGATCLFKMFCLWRFLCLVFFCDLKLQLFLLPSVLHYSEDAVEKAIRFLVLRFLSLENLVQGFDLIWG